MGLVAAHVDPAHDHQVAELARRCTVGQLRRILPTVAPPPPAPGPGPDAEEAAGEEGDAGAGVGDASCCRPTRAPWCKRPW
ncbi:MAG TPA: hypothetical protein VM263_00625, partial [Acidimicrobiales bacterium]|nr:hypothetical protein [Acidimicrobiales bacterium]